MGSPELKYQTGPHAIRDYSSGSKVTKQNIKEKEIVIQAGQPINITCSGDRNIFWKVPTSLEHNKRLRIAPAVCDGDLKTNCHRELIVNQSNISDTGLYICKSSSSTEKRSRIITSVYIFITEKNSPFVEMNNALPSAVEVIDGKPFVIPCRTTSPNITVTLRKAFSSELIIPDGRNITWDNKRGFIIKKLTQHHDLLKCVVLSDDAKEIDVFYLITKTSTALYSMNLNVSSSIKLLSGSFLSINCMVTTELNGRAELRWDYPGKKYGQLASILKTKMDRSNSTYHRFISTLVIPKVRKIDEGDYQCTATNGHNRVFALTTVHIQKKPSIKAQPRKQGTLEAVAGQRSLKIAVKVKAFPSPEVRWFKDDLLPVDKCARYIVNGYSLIIKDVREEDAGIYTLSLHIKNSNITENVSMRLIVKVKPQIYEKALPYHESHLYPLGSRQSLTCTAYGVPPPTITWMWQPCPHNHAKARCSFRSDGSRISLPVVFGKNVNQTGNRIQNIIQRTQMIEGKNKTVGILILNSSRMSGVYACAATNDVGTERREIPYYVTDVPNGLQISLNKEPSEGEDFILSCTANKYLYTDISWTLIRTAKNRTTHHSISKHRDAITNQYSTTLTALIRNTTHADSGIYSCKAKNIHTGEIVQERREIVIKGENTGQKKPKTLSLKRRKSSVTRERVVSH
ncbi:vascular endothelial growth factor receptor 1 [Pelobates cultripes]|uniref:Platelet-derived growth factor receptor-like protein n=1 Tax=Pelobates cultripes TaxID=61616 RepID=A0AAD1VME2_PELCU|nr:vascular endothelial growth factor receptor 1 [Pelobates cultripes]